jgi:excinuclease ABC subunit B
MYADTITESMQIVIDETNRRRRIQMDYNIAHGIEPKTVLKSREAILEQTKVADSKKTVKKYYVEQELPTIAADPLMQYLDKDQLQHLMDQTKRKMEQAARDLDFMEAARLRDELFELEKKYGK